MNFPHFAYGVVTLDKSQNILSFADCKITFCAESKKRLTGLLNPKSMAY